MPDYSKGKVYTIRCRLDDTLIYVGSTTQSLPMRWGGHKSKSKIYNTRKLYQSINDDWGNWYIELFEDFPCENKEQLNKREGEITREIGTLNYQIAGRTYKEWIEDNIDKVKLKQQEYNKNNAEKLKLTKREYYENNFEKLKLTQQEYNKNNADKIKERTKLYRENNKDKKREQDRLYHENNKDKLNEKHRERWKQYITCECGCVSTKYGLSKHLKTKKHIEALNPA